MKKLCSAGVVLALSASLAWAQAPAPKAAPAAKGDPKVAECRKHNGQEHASIMQMHAKAVKDHMISKGEEHRFREMEGRLNRHRAELAKGGLTLQECETIGKELAKEKEVLAKMAATPAKGPAKK